MLFNSFNFLIFFIIVTLLYFTLPQKFKWFLLLVSSCIFYMNFIPQYILILFFLIIIDYFVAIKIETSTPRIKKLYFFISILTMFSILFFFKYFNFFAENVTSIANAIGWNYSIQALSIILPVGLSFHTFQSLSYVVEVYRGKQKAERNIGMYALYVMYYPQLVAGPIERPQNLLHKFSEKHNFDFVRFIDGLKLMVWGFFKKVVIADRLAVIVTPVFTLPHYYVGPSLILATVAFSFQVYCDFSGYSDIARGCSRIMGIELMENFRKPYSAKSISDFWKRWHISLTTWFRDYLYHPIIGLKITKMRIYFATITIFLISGLWHGANWTFVIWGLIHGIYLVLSYSAKPLRNMLVEKSGLVKFSRLRSIFQIFLVFCMANLAFIFFRANNLKDAMYIVTHIFTGIFNPYSGIVSEIGLPYIISMAAFIIFMLIFDYTDGEKHGVIAQKFLPHQSIIIFVALMLILLFGAFFQGQSFIYFQF